MANKTRPKPNKTRNNHIFKVVGGKASKAKGKPKPVDIKLKKIVNTKAKTNEEVTKLDDNLLALRQQNSASLMSGTTVAKKPTSTKIQPVKASGGGPSDEKMDDIVSELSSVSTKN